MNSCVLLKYSQVVWLCAQKLLDFLLGLPFDEYTFSHKGIFSGSELNVKKGKVLVFLL